MAIFTEGRRRILSRTLMNASLIVLGAAFGSDIFIKFPSVIKVLSGAVAGIFFVAGFFAYPPTKNNNKEIKEE
jgi:hypothetical protein